MTTKKWYYQVVRNFFISTRVWSEQYPSAGPNILLYKIVIFTCLLIQLLDIAPEQTLMIIQKCMGRPHLTQPYPSYTMLLLLFKIFSPTQVCPSPLISTHVTQLLTCINTFFALYRPSIKLFPNNLTQLSYLPKFASET